MDKRIGVAVLVLLTVSLCYGFFGVKNAKESEPQKQANSGIAFPDMMNQLSRNMSLWPKLGQEEKKQAVSAIIGLYKNRENAAILNTPEFYVTKINESLRGNPVAASMDIMTMVRVLAVMEYDFYNGQDKEELAKKLLGEKGYQENKMRRQAGAQFNAQNLK
ncbi:MAG TPA: hypothetical protein PLL75_06225 [Candidatus Omnitrophota bacterium]|nr:hypothetical protein [Candidatus Omnitrophota bacterium]HPS37306.1 hypothetical protein [Candidatus Omnitrophota bacterium]